LGVRTPQRYDREPVIPYCLAELRSITETHDSDVCPSRGGIVRATRLDAVSMETQSALLESVTRCNSGGVTLGRRRAIDLPDRSALQNFPV
jgi:hypothetical protein